MKSLKIRFFPDHHQQIVLKTLSEEHRLLYNHLLENARNGSGFKEIYELHKKFRKENNLTIHSHSAQVTYHTFIEAIKSFYALKKKDPNSKFPRRFKSHKHFNTFSFHWNSGSGGFKFTEGGISIALDRKNNLLVDLPNHFLSSRICADNIKTMTVKKEEDKFFVIFTYQENDSYEKSNENNFLSIDLGVSSIASCFSNILKPFSIQNNRYKKIERRKENVHGLSDRKKKGSRRWKKLRKRYKKLCRKQSNKNKDFQHKVSRLIINECIKNEVGTLIVGDIQTKLLPKSKKANRGLNKSTQNQGTLSRFKTFLEYKSKNAGMRFHLVDESYTSQLNCLTGKKTLDSDLSIREVELEPGFTIDRDLNSATNIAKRHMGEWFTHNENFRDFLYGFRKMYVDTRSRLLAYDKI